MTTRHAIMIIATALAAGCGEEAVPVQTKDMSGADMAADLSTGDLQTDLDVFDQSAADDQAIDLDEDDSSPDLVEDMPAAFVRPVVKVLGEGQELLFERTFRYKLLELKCGDKEPTYAQWIEPDTGVARPFPVVAFTQPYAGIGWTGQEVDERWFTRGAGLHLDDSEPSFVPGSDAKIVYDPMTPKQGVEQGSVFTINGFGVLHMFGRFYAGGSIQNDVDDMTCALSYLEQAQGADLERIAILGGSWGGFEAVYGALYAPPEVAPKLGVALYPLTDFEQEWRFVDAAEANPNPTAAAAFRAFFEPYKRRIKQTTGGAPGAGDFSGFTHAALAASPNQTRFVTIHDSDDVLVPFTMGQELAIELGERVQPVWVMSPEPVDVARVSLTHGDRMNELSTSLLTLHTAHIQTQLATPAQQLLVIYDPANLKKLLGYVRAQKDRGQGTQTLAARLAELADPRVILFDTTNNQAKAGAEVISAMVNEVFETGYTPLTIAPGLRRNGL